MGSVTGAHPEKIEQAFSAAILPLFAPPGKHDSPAIRRDASARAIARETGLSPWKIETLNPGLAVFTDFAETDLSKKFGRLVLRNDYLSEQHQTHIRQGRPGGLGPNSGRTVFEANTLRLQLSLLYRPRTPGIAFVLKKLSRHRTDRTGIAWQKGYLVAELITEVMMQSHAQLWSESGESNRRGMANKHHAPASMRIQPYLPDLPTSSEPDSAEVPIRIQSPSLSHSTSRSASSLSGQGIALETKNEPAAVNAETAEEKKLCDGLLCCQ